MNSRHLLRARYPGVLLDSEMDAALLVGVWVRLPSPQAGSAALIADQTERLAVVKGSPRLSNTLGEEVPDFWPRVSGRQRGSKGARRDGMEMLPADVADLLAPCPSLPLRLACGSLV